MNAGGDMSTLFERVGGEAAVEAAVVRLYERIMGDPLLARYFESLDMNKQIEKQIAFVTMALGGPNQYTGRDLRIAHARLRGLGDAHFDAVAGHFGAVLAELGVDAASIDEALTIVSGTRPDVLNK